MMKYAILLLTVSILSAHSMPAYSEDKIDQAIEKLKTHARIDWGGVSAPAGKLLLVKKGKDTCAVRFTMFRRGHDAKAATVFKGGDETFYADYEWFCQADGSGNFKKRNITKGSGKLVRKPLNGIGRLAFQTGNEEVKCGPFSLFWYFPTFVSFASTPACSNSGIELSPTKWVGIEEIDSSRSTLKWYQCDEKRKNIYVPIEEF